MNVWPAFLAVKAAVLLAASPFVGADSTACLIGGLVALAFVPVFAIIGRRA